MDSGGQGGAWVALTEREAWGRGLLGGAVHPELVGQVLAKAGKAAG